ncbi:DUF1127 domain-containing protein [Yangia mangrovi]|uniref:DUF1127 domain-containing protein n=2 Tax=Alloyangia TaxID=2919626 RepID=A0AAU8AIK7_9RHOB|nr:DUF1127 domain-containing protein [Alloyangia mangrovi]MCA0939144.1 DUF1127 domain-containing protein [Alloyangia pacifica]MCA0947621.1 DUF1127 domain-containing protein [Alloyangia pacifica]MCT4372979.1 DUF1127 domain-containing protein [Alloyangia mangrovi]
MAAYDYSRDATGAAGLAGRIGNVFVTGFAPVAADETPRSAGLFATLFGMVAEWNDARLTRKSLMALTDRELDDIGLTRADIPAIARRR